MIGRTLTPWGEIEIGARATVAQEAYLSTGSHDFAQPSMPLVTAKITIGEDAFLGARVVRDAGCDGRRAQLLSGPARS
ncbi:MAG: hypothetical protein WKF47_06335 [Geodermatophilaceae bacterium]